MTELLEKLTKIILPLNKRDLPESPGIYVFFDTDKPIYIGKAINLRRRISSYFDLDLELKTEHMVKEAKSLSFIRVDSELEALLLEAKLIRSYMPRYNITAKDDKHPLYILITKEKYPRIITGRKTDLDKGKFIATYGPFPSSTSVRHVLRMLRRIFPYSDHKLGKRGCLYSHIGLCNPCPSEIEGKPNETELRKRYLKNIRNIKAILDGKIDKVERDLEHEMKLAAKQEDYEAAALARDQIKRFEYVTQPQTSVDVFMENPNLYEDLRIKELKELKEIINKIGDFKLTKLVRIECFDIAHLAGSSPTASMVTFINAEADKKYYRHFKINQKKTQSDIDSLKEVIKRRLKHLQDWGKPDLIIVDGGKAQTALFVRELEEVAIPVVGLAKRFETLVIPTKIDGTVSLKEYRIPRGAALNLVQRLRDEAHRFARRYHHKLVSKTFSGREN